MSRPLRSVTPGEAASVRPPWEVLGFESERDMLVDDLQSLEKRLKSEATAAHAVVAISKRKQEIFEQIMHLDSGDMDDDVLDDSEDEEWNVEE